MCAHFSWVGLGLGLGLGGVWVSVGLNGFGSGNSYFTLLVNLNGFLFQGILLYSGVTTRTEGRQVCAHVSWVGLVLGLDLGWVAFGFLLE